MNIDKYIMPKINAPMPDIDKFLKEMDLEINKILERREQQEQEMYDSEIFHDNMKEESTKDSDEMKTENLQMMVDEFPDGASSRYARSQPCPAVAAKKIIEGDIHMDDLMGEING